MHVKQYNLYIFSKNPVQEKCIPMISQRIRTNL